MVGYLLMPEGVRVQAATSGLPSRADPGARENGAAEEHGCFLFNKPELGLCLL